MTEVYKTNVETRQQAGWIIKLLQYSFSEARINFDLQDCDRILRVEGIKPADAVEVISNMARFGFKCEILK